MKHLHLERIEDESGVSGTGIVAEGIIFSNGKCAINWLTKYSSIAVYENIEDVEFIHGHNGKTKVVIEDALLEAAKNMVSAISAMRSFEDKWLSNGEKSDTEWELCMQETQDAEAMIIVCENQLRAAIAQAEGGEG